MRAMDKVGKTLIRAAELIAERGHSKYEMQKIDGSLCFMGAIMVANGQNPLDDPYNDATRICRKCLCALIDEHTPVLLNSLVSSEEAQDILIAAAYWRLP